MFELNHYLTNWEVPDDNFHYGLEGRIMHGGPMIFFTYKINWFIGFNNSITSEKNKIGFSLGISI